MVSEAVKAAEWRAAAVRKEALVAVEDLDEALEGELEKCSTFACSRLGYAAEALRSSGAAEATGGREGVLRALNAALGTLVHLLRFVDNNLAVVRGAQTSRRPEERARRWTVHLRALESVEPLAASLLASVRASTPGLDELVRPEPSGISLELERSEAAERETLFSLVETCDAALHKKKKKHHVTAHDDPAKREPVQRSVASSSRLLETRVLRQRWHQPRDERPLFALFSGAALQAAALTAILPTGHLYAASIGARRSFVGILVGATPMASLTCASQTTANDLVTGSLLCAAAGAVYGLVPRLVGAGPVAQSLAVASRALLGIGVGRSERARRLVASSPRYASASAFGAGFGPLLTAAVATTLPFTKARSLVSETTLPSLILAVFCLLQIPLDLGCVRTTESSCVLRRRQQHSSSAVTTTSPDDLRKWLISLAVDLFDDDDDGHVEDSRDGAAKEEKEAVNPQDKSLLDAAERGGSPSSSSSSSSSCKALSPSQRWALKSALCCMVATSVAREMIAVSAAMVSGDAFRWSAAESGCFVGMLYCAGAPAAAWVVECSLDRSRRWTDFVRRTERVLKVAVVLSALASLGLLLWPLSLEEDDDDDPFRFYDTARQSPAPYLYGAFAATTFVASAIPEAFATTLIAAVAPPHEALFVTALAAFSRGLGDCCLALTIGSIPRRKVARSNSGLAVPTVLSLLAAAYCAFHSVPGGGPKRKSHPPHRRLASSPPDSAPDSDVTTPSHRNNAAPRYPLLPSNYGTLPPSSLLQDDDDDERASVL